MQTSASFLELSPLQRKKLRKVLKEQLDQDSNVVINTFATLGLKKDTQCLLWIQSEKIENIQDFLNTMLHSSLGRYVTISYTLFGIVHSSQYASQSSAQNETNWKGAKYLIIYPFTKTHEWYQLDFATRKELMRGHITIGKKFPQISQLLLYSYGVDDQEFIVSYETEDLTDFQRLVIALRADKVREYTKNDTPIFTCIHKSLDEFVTFL